ncbi:hypothetical protein B0181_01960 [Moraxella caviae]|uniref:Uncharacterized protein n=1 Tax=Moraxella caviae TaxID=34060 RepID=A0A1T0AAB4_9GAMM|nr:hypothetical protein B0181_01960 [Moraxella caviae]
MYCQGLKCPQVKFGLSKGQELRRKNVMLCKVCKSVRLYFASDKDLYLTKVARQTKNIQMFTKNLLSQPPIIS